MPGGVKIEIQGRAQQGVIAVDSPRHSESAAPHPIKRLSRQRVQGAMQSALAQHAFAQCSRGTSHCRYAARRQGAGVRRKRRCHLAKSVSLDLGIAIDKKCQRRIGYDNTKIFVPGMRLVAHCHGPDSNARAGRKRQPSDCGTRAFCQIRIAIDHHIDHGRFPANGMRCGFNADEQAFDAFARGENGYRPIERLDRGWICRTFIQHNLEINRSNQHLGWCGVAQKCGRACRQAIGAGLHDDDQIADLGMAQFHFVAQDVQRCAQRADCGRD